jgi:hypothetical protein
MTTTKGDDEMPDARKQRGNGLEIAMFAVPKVDICNP